MLFRWRSWKMKLISAFFRILVVISHYFIITTNSKKVEIVTTISKNVDKPSKLSQSCPKMWHPISQNFVASKLLLLGRKPIGRSVSSQPNTELYLQLKMYSTFFLKLLLFVNSYKLVNAKTSASTFTTIEIPPSGAKYEDDEKPSNNNLGCCCFLFRYFISGCHWH